MIISGLFCEFPKDSYASPRASNDYLEHIKTSVFVRKLTKNYVLVDANTHILYDIGELPV